MPVVEDAAQAAGTTYVHGRPGGLGDDRDVLFFPSKNLGGFGDGGMITTNDAEIADRVRMLRFHGSYDKVTYQHVGYNSRLDELQAAILRVLLPQLDGWADGRRAAGRHYAEAGLGELVTLPQPSPGAEPAWHLYVVRHERADDLAAALEARGIGQKAYYRVPIHRQPAMAGLGAGADLPATEEVARTHLAIPMSAVLDAEQVAEVVAAVRGFAAGA